MGELGGETIAMETFDDKHVIISEKSNHRSSVLLDEIIEYITCSWTCSGAKEHAKSLRTVPLSGHRLVEKVESH